MVKSRFLQSMTCGYLSVASLCTGSLAQSTPPGPPPGYPELPGHITDFRARAAIIRMERVQGGIPWQQRPAVQFKIELTIAGGRPSTSTVLLERSTGRVRMEHADGTVLIFDGQATWSSTQEAATPGSRRLALRVPFLFMAPLRLREQDLTVTAGEMQAIGLTRFKTLHAIYKPESPRRLGEGYTVFEDPSQFRAGAVAYDTPNGSKHLVRFDAFDTVEGVMHPTKWTFWNISAVGGIEGESTGSAAISDVSFPTPAEDAFKPGDDAVKIGT